MATAKKKKNSLTSLFNRKKVTKKDPVKAVKKTVRKAVKAKSEKLEGSEFGRILKRAEQIHKKSPVVSTRTIKIRKISIAKAKKMALAESKGRLKFK